MKTKQRKHDKKENEAKKTKKIIRERERERK